jgi:hypothetical protein
LLAHLLFNQVWHNGCFVFFLGDFGEEERLERIFMNEFLLFALVIVYMVISYRPTSTAARNGQQSQLNRTASHGPRDAEDH